MWPNEFETFDALIKYTYGDTPCELSPELCKPREIQHVIWDADDTIWDIQGAGIATFVSPPLHKISRESCEGKKRTPRNIAFKGDLLITEETDIAVNLKIGMLDTLEELSRRGIGSSIVSANEPGAVERILKVLGIRDKFDIVKSNWNPKAQSVHEIIRKTGIAGDKIIFVDDDLLNVGIVVEDIGTLGLVMDKDIHEPQDVLKYIK